MAKKINVLKVNLFIACLFFLIASCASKSGSASISTRTELQQPRWLEDPYTKVNKSEYIAAVGSGSSRDNAVIAAFGELLSYFNQRIKVEDRTSETYWNILMNTTNNDWLINTNVNRISERTTGMDNIIGAEIQSHYDDGMGTHFALAILHRATAIRVYSEIIIANQEIITILTNISPTDRYTMESYSCFMSAAIIADINVKYWEMLTVLGAQVQQQKNGTDYRREAREISRVIPIGIVITNDRANMIQGVLSRAVSANGFVLGDKNSPYILEANIILSRVYDYPDSNMEHVRITLDANLLSVNTGTVLLPYNIGERRFSHNTISGAENRAFIFIERTINNGINELNFQLPSYEEYLNNYLLSLINR